MPEIHVDDVGTRYRCRVKDNGTDFDPSSASTKALVFSMPGLVDDASAAVTSLRRAADVEVGAGEEAGRYYLTYTVVPADVTDHGFHSVAGRVRVQGHLVYADGSEFHSDVQDSDDEGHVLTVERNI
jgi:hypothetical protein